MAKQVDQPGKAAASGPRGRERLIVALDTADLATAVRWTEALRGEVGLVKVGLELFSAEGPRGLERIGAVGIPIFLDLKLHDIPNTVAGAISTLARSAVALTTLHAAGGRRMIEAAATARDRSGTPLRLLAVTVLTSLDEAALAEIGIAGGATERAVAWSLLAASAGADGAVCSPLEAARLRAELPAGFLLVTPGIRPAEAPADDQARTATPLQAVRNGADYLVVGRPVTRAADPAAAARLLAAGLE